ncbi:DEAD-box ATP-dependent RNA helicase 52A-like isoform X2 [Triticum urartu]|uniref:DEAD-box ATP-dependent RNA helicase 52A-like isoform X2 n=1 Tax=Triticum urartu TaxID=4572 RepID=UPI002043A045|nr:DEAD-box ATP-dependent RNA helicase 52A-like isoform X2 [Triticum urartu]
MSRHGVLPDEEDMIDLPPYISPATLLPKVRAYEMAAPDSICVHHLVARPAGDEHAKGLAELRIVEGAIGNLSREALPGPMYRFQELGLAEAVLHNLARCHFETPSPLQCYSIPMVLAGRDLLVCAQKGSGKTTALLIPVLSGLVTAPVAAGRTGRMKCVKPRALLLVPTARLAKQIGADIRKFSYRTGIRVHSKMKGKMQKCQLEAGIDIVVSTPLRLINMVRTSQVSLEAIKYLVICELGLMLDMGFEKTLRKIVDDMHIPPKSARHTLLSSGTFQPAVQKLAWDFLSDYLFITDGRLEFSIGLTKQKIELASEEEKTGLLLNLLQKQSVSSAGMSQLRTVVFVETKGKADSLKNWLCNEGFPATVIFADSSQQERERAHRYLSRLAAFLS